MMQSTSSVANDLPLLDLISACVGCIQFKIHCTHDCLCFLVLYMTYSTLTMRYLEVNQEWSFERLTVTKYFCKMLNLNCLSFLLLNNLCVFLSTFFLVCKLSTNFVLLWGWRLALGLSNISRFWLYSNLKVYPMSCSYMSMPEFRKIREFIFQCRTCFWRNHTRSREGLLPKDCRMLGWVLYWGK